MQKIAVIGASRRIGDRSFGAAFCFVSSLLARRKADQTDMIEALKDHRK